MKKHLGILLTLIVTALGPQLTFAADPDNMEHANREKDPLAVELSERSGAEFEAAFLSLMIQHHQGGVKMAKMAEDKAKSGKLKAMMQKAAADQQREIEQMTGWLQQWHKKSPQDFKTPEASMKMMEKDMAALEVARGEEFDTLFATKMAHHHLGAIEMSKLAKTKASHEETKELASKIIEVQSKERNELLSMHK